MSDKLFLILTSGSREKLQMAGMTAAVAAVSGTDVAVFLSMNALRHFIKGRTAPFTDEGEMGTLLEQRHAPNPIDLFNQAVDLGGAKLYPCSMAMDVLGVSEEELMPGLDKPMGLTKFLGDMIGNTVLTF